MTTRYVSLAMLAAAAVLMLAPDDAQADGYGGGRCYLRVDGIYGWSTSHEANATVSPAFGTPLGKVANGNLDGNWLGEIGVGCHLLHRVSHGSTKDGPHWGSGLSGLRGDITYGYIGERRYTGVPSIGVPPFVTQVDARMNTTTLLFNGYYDLPKMLGVTPYLGAGVGLAFQEINRVLFWNGNNTFVAVPSVDETSFAWSLSTGFSVNLGADVMFDVGYRYLGLASIGTGVASSGHSLSISNPSQHQLKVGLRVPLGIWFD